MNTLPHTLHGLLDAARRDIYKVLSAPHRYTLNMDRWVEYNPTTKMCEVCLAGAVMVNSLGLVADAHHRKPSLYYFAGGLDLKLRAINQLREGDPVSAIKVLYGIREEYLEHNPRWALLGVSDVDEYRMYALTWGRLAGDALTKVDVDKFFSHPNLMEFRKLLLKYNI